MRRFRIVDIVQLVTLCVRAILEIVRDLGGPRV